MSRPARRFWCASSQPPHALPPTVPSRACTVPRMQVEKGAKKYKLDKQGNIINPDFADVAPAPAAPAPSPFAAAFGGVGASSGGSGFTFGAGAAAPAGGGFTFGSGPGAAPAPAGGGFVFGGKPTASNGASVFGGGSGGSGFIFGSPGPAPAPAVTDGASKRPAGASTAPKAKRGRTNALRLTGSETGCVLIVGNGDCGQLGLGSGDDDVRDSLKPIRMSALDAMRICQVWEPLEGLFALPVRQGGLLQGAYFGLRAFHAQFTKACCSCKRQYGNVRVEWGELELRPSLRYDCGLGADRSFSCPEPVSHGLVILMWLISAGSLWWVAHGGSQYRRQAMVLGLQR